MIILKKKLITLSVRISQRGKLNLLSLHTHSENFYRDFFNKLYGWNLENLNQRILNVEAIDLVDNTNKIVIQVSAVNTKTKIDSALSKESLKSYIGYQFKFINICKDAKSLRNQSYDNPHKLSFIASKDILDVHSILKDIMGLKTQELKNIFDFIKSELGGEIDITKLESNLATIINILSEENWDDNKKELLINTFEIDRKITINNLDSSIGIINDYKIYYSEVDKKYAEFDKLGKNKSSSVLSAIRNEYLMAKNNKNPDDLFFHVIDKVQEKIVNSSNYKKIPQEELLLCINILVVDAFIRCKIFENPINYNYASSR